MLQVIQEDKLNNYDLLLSIQNFGVKNMNALIVAFIY